MFVDEIVLRARISSAKFHRNFQNIPWSLIMILIQTRHVSHWDDDDISLSAILRFVFTVGTFRVEKKVRFFYVPDFFETFKLSLLD